MRNPLTVAAEALRVHEEGPWPFITLRRYTLGDRHFVWIARRWRKGLAGSVHAQERGPFWRRPAYNWWTGAQFAVGSLLFMAGAALSLLPAAVAPSSALINAVFAAGSVPFTIGAYLQHFQAANAPGFAPGPDPQRAVGASR